MTGVQTCALPISTRPANRSTWSLDQTPSRIESYLASEYERNAPAHVIIWFVVSFPVGWILGIVVTLADLVRPTPD